MGKKNRQRDEFWEQAKKACRLTDRQVAQAKKLGMNPKKLPKLRPSSSQPWKLSVGAFIEQCYAKRFGKDESGGQSKVDERVTRPEPYKPDQVVRGLIATLEELKTELERDLANGPTPASISRMATMFQEIAHVLHEEADLCWEARSRDEPRAPRAPLDDSDIPF